MAGAIFSLLSGEEALLKVAQIEEEMEKVEEIEAALQTKIDGKTIVIVGREEDGRSAFMEKLRTFEAVEEGAIAILVVGEDIDMETRIPRALVKEAARLNCEIFQYNDNNEV